ncbi:MAG TPA: adenylate/guanylate cyclase domain-containing protein [Nitrospirales bacterium]|nr:adenylate/guanylate cyclase domain-containing protein [Nitrospirales bacterium]
MRFSPREWSGSYVASLFACSVIAIALPLLLNFMGPSLLEPVELWTVDLRFQHRPPLAVSDDPLQNRSSTVVSFDYDDRAAYDYGLGRWPWDRRIHAQVLGLLSKSGARAVLVDLLFDHAATNPAEDKALVEATRNAGMVYYPIALRPATKGESGELVRFPAPRHLLQAEAQGFGEIPVAADVTLPLPGLIETAKGLGHIQRTPDRDGVVRRVPLIYAVKGGFVPSLALAAALRQLDVDRTSVRIDRGKTIRFKSRKGDEVVIPIDEQGRTWINYAGPWGAHFHHYPYSWILDQLKSEQGKAKLPDRFNGKIVILSNLTTGSGSRMATPFEGDFPSSEVQLHLLNMLLRQQFLREATGLESALCLGTPVLLLTGAALAGGPWMVLAGFVAVLGGYLLALQQVFNAAGVILPAVNPILALAFAPILLLVTRFLFVDRERLRFQSVLGGFLPPQTIKAIQENPQTIPRLLAGRTRELTVFFADIKGFSAFCKRADPLQIQRILRDYLTAMTIVLRGYGGTLDKYMGDGIMAFFGDAEPEGGGEEAEERRVERNAANAVRAALAMQKKMTELNLRWLSQGQEPHLIRIGINTGFVTVGNLGTEYLWDYTVIGPEVNKAQRLESAAHPGALLLARRTYALARNLGVLPDDLPPCTFALKGIGEETDLYAVPAELVAQLAVSPPYQEEREKIESQIS